MVGREGLNKGNKGKRRGKKNQCCTSLLLVPLYVNVPRNSTLIRAISEGSQLLVEAANHSPLTYLLHHSYQDLLNCSLLTLIHFCMQLLKHVCTVMYSTTLDRHCNKPRHVHRKHLLIYIICYFLCNRYTCTLTYVS